MKSDIEFRTECFRRLKPKFDQEFRSGGGVGIFQSDVLFRKKPGQTLISHIMLNQNKVIIVMVMRKMKIQTLIRKQNPQVLITRFSAP